MKRRHVVNEHAEKFLPEGKKVPSGRGKAASLNPDSVSTQEEALTRGTMYQFLSTIYLSPPEQDLVRQVTEKNFLGELSSLFGDKAVAELKEFAAGFDKDFASLRQEYMDLFAVPTGRYVTPFEDVYQGATKEGKPVKGPLLGPRAVSVIRMYREAGAEMDRACKELATHIGVQLSFMSFLCEREGEAIPHEKWDARPDSSPGEAANSVKYRELQIRFLKEHLNDWFPRLSRSIQANAKSRFYRGLALLTEEFLARDTASLLAQSRSEKQMGPKDL
jgi:TorA maturation chaperone TorD